ncbi:MAG: hypothetical protein ACOC3V_01405 [bacterium]
MPRIDYNRYTLLKKEDGGIEQPPFVNLPKNLSDKYINWVNGVDRLDKISVKYYGNPFYDFLILYANPKYISEFDIPDGALIRIPFPLSKILSDYEEIINTKLDL